MNQKVIIVTGAAGFLGSAITVDLSRDHKIVAIDRRKPTIIVADQLFPERRQWR
jgi:nucleoside-diphosphate-sugar epimerase